MMPFLIRRRNRGQNSDLSLRLQNKSAIMVSTCMFDMNGDGIFFLSKFLIDSVTLGDRSRRVAIS